PPRGPPTSTLDPLFASARQAPNKHGSPSACSGHAGDANVHVNIMVDFNAPGAKRRSETALDDLFAKVLKLGGAITGEHGIGLAKKKWWPWATTREVRALHSKIKRALDPNDILNPGKFL